LHLGGLDMTVMLILSQDGDMGLAAVLWAW